MAFCMDLTRRINNIKNICIYILKKNKVKEKKRKKNFYSVLLIPVHKRKKWCNISSLGRRGSKFFFLGRLQLGICMHRGFAKGVPGVC